LTATGNNGLGVDLTQWTFWWEFNKDGYLNLKSAVHSTSVTTGDSSWFIGHGQKTRRGDSMAPDPALVRQRIVPALRRALLTETSNDIVTGAMVALAKIGDVRDESGESEFEGLFVPFLADANQEIAETAAVALGILAHDASVPTLEHLLGDTAPGRRLVGGKAVPARTRPFAAYALSLIGSRTPDEGVRQGIVRTLTRVLDADLAQARDIKAACLIAYGLVPLQVLGSESTAEENAPLPEETRVGQLEYALAFLDRDEESFLVRAHAPTTLARLLVGLPDQLHASYKDRVTERLLAQLARGARAQNEEVQSVVIALGLMGDNDADPTDERIREALIRIPKDVNDIQTRNFSMIALGQVGGRRGEAGSDAEAIRDVQRALTSQLARGNETLKPWAGLGIGVMGAAMNEDGVMPPPDMLRALRAALIGEKSPGRVGAYAVSAGIVRDIDSKAPALEKLEKLRDPESRGYVAVSLGLMKAREAVEPIQEILAESKYQPVLLRQAAVGLGLLGDKTLVGDLTDMLREAKALSSQAALCSALGFIGDKNSVEPLLELMGNEQLTDRARGFAAVALGIVADKDPLPWNSRISAGLNYRASTETLNDPQGTGILNIL